MTKNDKLLNEQTLRRWAKLADLTVINQDLLISEDVDTETEETTEEEETVTENADTEEITEEEPVAELEEAEHEEMPEEEGMEDMEVEADEGAEENDVVMAVLKALAPFGVEMDDDEAEGEMEMEPEAEEDPAMDHGMKDDPAMGDHYNRQDEDELTEAVLTRVLKRISELNDK